MTLLITITSFIALMLFLVGFHELGHYLAARWTGISVKTFSVGFGHPVMKWRAGSGVNWQVSWLPLGGYVAFAEKDGEGSRGVLFPDAALWKRLVTIVAGPAANVLLAFLLFWGSAVSFGTLDAPPVVAEVQAGSPAEAAGLLPGDRITAINGYPVSRMAHVVNLISPQLEGTVDVSYVRDGDATTVTMPVAVRAIEDRGQTVELGYIGFTSVEAERVFHGPIEAVSAAAENVAAKTLSIVLIIASVMTGDRPLNIFSGPVGVAEMTGIMVVAAETMALFAALLSLNLAIINMMPFPPFDGGQILTNCLTSLFGRERTTLIVNAASLAGVAFVALLAIYLTYHDILRILG